ncbi:HD-GYP domain-containing protein [Terriglobus roseus DSM 18391]|uniref:HD-GYP domain-containing protein n=1 Tax=Terriglobus roseus (strain DSM 18391 / NRRL B-41598 / KBS 63) TaxID=926566 RepID=I3ZKV4_TERRK|nr:HD domain-containing protein [Terriglobus roseus]AFL89872.1 HD-GYP domain-containing protein [Terriglobus roseus DSM 18391]
MSNSSSNAVLYSADGQPVTLGEILSALSFALDMTEGARPGHSLRACLIGMRLGKQIGLSSQALADLYYALLLKDIGCSSNSARMAGAFTAADQVVKQRFKFVDKEKLGKPNREALTFVWSNVAPTANVWSRIRQIYRMVRAPGNLTAEMVEERCESGALILDKLGMGIETCAGVYSLDEQWNGHGLPDHLVAQEIPLLGRVCAVAQHLDSFCSEFGSAKAMATLADRSGVWFDPDLVRAAESLHQQEALWENCVPGSDPRLLQTAVLALDPGSSTALASRHIDLICSGFADVIDAKSPFTHRHSVGTTEAAVLISNAMGLAPSRVDVVRRAAMLHDIGMLSVPNTILDKPAPLTREEWVVIHRHPVLSQEILSRVSAFSEIAILAGQHHEKLDGSGYPFHLHGQQLSIESRILTAADVFSALMESRPHRQDLSPAEILQQLEQDVPHRLDPACFDAIVSVLDQLAVLPLDDIPGRSADTIPELVMVEPPPFRFEANPR